MFDICGCNAAASNADQQLPQQSEQGVCNRVLLMIMKAMNNMVKPDLIGVAYEGMYKLYSQQLQHNHFQTV